MIYTPLTNKALRFDYNAHMGQMDYNGVPYIFHPLHLAAQMDDEISCCAALLHDVVEDTHYTFEDLRQLGFAPQVLEALQLLTHDDRIPYLDYVRALKKNPIARAVKLADLRHNSDLSRLDVVDDTALRRNAKYAQALALLEE